MVKKNAYKKILILCGVTLFVLNISLLSPTAKTPLKEHPAITDIDALTNSSEADGETTLSPPQLKQEEPPIETPAPKKETPEENISFPPSEEAKEDPREDQENLLSPIPNQSANTLVRNAVVNILCSNTSKTLSSITGSGVIIDPSGIILTNAHLAQYFLLADYPNPGTINCVIRTGSPAYPRYRAELLYLSPSWIAENASEIVSSDPTGTGEFDYAFLRITEAIDGSPLPPFSFIVPNQTAPAVDSSIIIAGYPASFLGAIAVARDLYLTSSIGTVREVYTFGDNHPDLISIGGTILAQKGASGGAVADGAGRLLGIVVTTTEADSTSNRDLRAITFEHIQRALKNETGITVDELMSGNTEATAQSFNDTVAPLLRDYLLKELEAD